MREIVALMYVLGALIAVGAAATVVARAVKHGPTIGGWNDFTESTLNPRKAWPAFVGVAAGVALTTAASVTSLWLPPL